MLVFCLYHTHLMCVIENTIKGFAMNHATKVAVTILLNSARLGWVSAPPDIGEIFRQTVSKLSPLGKHYSQIDCRLYSTLQFSHNTVLPTLKGTDIPDLHPSPAASNFIKDLCNTTIDRRMKPNESLHRKWISTVFEH